MKASFKTIHVTPLILFACCAHFSSALSDGKHEL
jgi:hypothetical protein